MMVGVVVWVVAAPWPPGCPHPSPLPPSGRGDGCCGRGCCLNRRLRRFSLMGCDAPRPFVPVFWMDVPSAEALGIWCWLLGRRGSVRRVLGLRIGGLLGCLTVGEGG